MLDERQLNPTTWAKGSLSQNLDECSWKGRYTLYLRNTCWSTVVNFIKLIHYFYEFLILSHPSLGKSPLLHAIK